MSYTLNHKKSPAILAYERKLEATPATLKSANWADLESTGFSIEALKKAADIPVFEKSSRSAFSNRPGKAKGGDTSNDEASKTGNKLTDSNIQKVDFASLPMESDTLVQHFFVKIFGGLGTPSACGDAQYGKDLNAYVQETLQDDKIVDELSQRYLANMVNTRSCWRNRFGSKKGVVIIRANDETITVKASGEEFAKILRFQESGVYNYDNPIAKMIAKTIRGDENTPCLHIEVVTAIHMGFGAEIFPSQEMVTEKVKHGKTKFLYDVNGCAAFHSQKVGNAIRTIDTWYNGAEGNPIAVEVFGAVIGQGVVHRNTSESPNFYTLLDGLMSGKRKLTEDEKKYFLALLIRGGVFGEGDEKK